MSTPSSRRVLSDRALLAQLDTYLAYATKPGALDFWAWAETKDFNPADGEFLRAAYLGATLVLRRAS